MTSPSSRHRRTLVVIGGDAAGMSAASQARRGDADLEIIAFERSEHTSYAACGMPYLVGGLVSGPERLIARRPEVFRERQNIQVATRHEVTGIDTQAQRIEGVALETGERFVQAYDDLLIAVGARAVGPEIPNADAPGVFSLRSLESGIALWNHVREGKPGKAVVVGGGYIGLEVAEALRLRGIDTSLVHRGAEVMSTLDPDMGKLASEAVRAFGISLYLGESPRRIEVTGGWVSGVVTAGRQLPADLVVMGTGVRPNSDLADAAGIPLGVHGSIRVDARMQTLVPHVWAAGDCAETVHLMTGQPFWAALGTVANKMGRVAGINLSGGDAVFPGVLGTGITRVGTTEIAHTGLKTLDLEMAGLDYAVTTIQDYAQARYFPDAAKITVRLFAERGTGRLLGCQIVGGPGSGKRIDTVAAALTGRLTVQDLLDMDLAYAPPFSPVWDPVQTAARVLINDI